MTLDSRLTAALARRGPQRLGQFITNALGLACGPHHGGAACHFYAGDEVIVAHLERYADQIEGARTPSRPTTSADLQEAQ